MIFFFWNLHCILEELNACNITVPSRLSHKELFKYRLIHQNSIDTQKADRSVGNPISILTKGKGKAPAKKRSGRQSALPAAGTQLLICTQKSDSSPK